MNSVHSLREYYDAIIVGSRCAGAATGLLLARSGARVLVVDRGTYGSDTLSTHALMRSAVLQLSRWGILPDLVKAGTPEIRATIFHYADEAIRIGIKSEHGVECLFAPRRMLLDRILVDTARKAGAEVRHGVALVDLLFAPDGRVTGAVLTNADRERISVRSGIVVGADGRQSTVARLVKARVRDMADHASGVVFGYFEGLSGDGFHWHFGESVAAGVIPTNGGHCVFAAVPSPRFHTTFRGDVMGGFLQILEANAPQLRAEVEHGTLSGQLRGFAGVPGYLRQCCGPGWALVGDAGYFKDPLTAHGITDAFRDAEFLSRAILTQTDNSLEAYQQERDELSRPFLGLTDKIASFTWDLPALKELHTSLNSLMKHEAGCVAALSQSPFPMARRTEPMTDLPWMRTIAGAPTLGAEASRTRKTTMRDVERFTAMTGDRNPIHYDTALAERSPFGGLIVQGGVTTGLLNAVVAEDLPGPGTVFLETNWRFLKAVRVGETITATVRVEHVRHDKPICRLETIVRNSNGETCVAGTATTYTMPLRGRKDEPVVVAA